MEKSIAAEAYLSRDRLHHIDMLEALRRKMADIVYAGPEGVLLYNAMSECWVISAATPEASLHMLAIPESPDFICAHQEFTVSQLQKTYDSPFFLDCVQTAYFKSDPVPVPSVCTFRAMEPGDAQWVNENYRNDPGELDYVRSLLEKGLITGAYVNGRCAGFIGRHSEGSIGLLEVLPKYRRQGVGSALFRDALNRELQRGNIPFGQVEWGNEPSLALQRKTGCTVSEGHVYWMSLVPRQ